MFSFPGRGRGSWSPALPRVSEIGWGGAGWTEVTSWLPSSISESALLGGVGMTVKRHLSTWREVSETTFQYYLRCFHQPKETRSGGNHRQNGCVLDSTWRVVWSAGSLGGLYVASAASVSYTGFSNHKNNFLGLWGSPGHSSGENSCRHCSI